MKFSYPFKGVCSKGVSFDLSEDMIVKNVTFDRGCPGNTTGVASLANGRKLDELVAALQGTLCENRPTSCPDQFARALLLAKESLRAKKEAI